MNIETLREKRISDVGVVALVKAKDWYPEGSFKKAPFWILENDTLVVEYSDYGDGHIEGRITVAICRLLGVAITVYESY